MQFAGRRIISTTLNPIPRSFRASPGVLAVNHLEAKALEEGNGEVFKELMAICHAEDRADAMQVYKFKPRKTTGKLAPSTRLTMINAIRAGK